ncbi:MAG: tetratricopeptide repeat protein, partial [Chitinivibrionales bacterium]|nr:tetratricopeptide repeat protein [Chitinivibrionales bacterium]
MSRIAPIRSLMFSIVLIAWIFSAFADETFDKLIADQKYKEAIQYADDKIPAEARKADIWVKLAKANEELGFNEKALACYMVSWRLNPSDYQSLLGAAKIYNKLSQPDNAMTMAQKALAINFTAEASWEYARACIQLNRSAEAKKALEKVIETDAGNVVANRELGLIYYNDKQYEKALPLLKTSLIKKPEAELYLKIGRAYLEIRALDSAITYLKLAASKAGGVSEANLMLARAYFSTDNFSAAAAEYDRIVGKASLKPADYYDRAVAKEKTGNADDAVAAYTAAVKEFGSDAGSEALQARMKVAKDQLSHKSFQAALTNLEFVRAADKAGQYSPEILFLLADANEGAK